MRATFGAAAGCACLALVACQEEEGAAAVDGELAAKLEKAMTEQQELQQQVDRLRSENDSKAGEIKAELEVREEALKQLKDELEALKQEKATLEADYETYRKEYKANIREKAKGIDLGNLTTRSGSPFKNVVVTKWEPDGLRVMHSEGSVKLFFADLPQQIQELFVYDSEETASLLASVGEPAKPRQPDPAIPGPGGKDAGGGTPNPGDTLETWPKGGLPESPKKRLNATELAIAKLSFEIAAKETEVNKVDKDIEEAYRRGSQSRGKSLEKKAERIMDDLKALRANRRELERKVEARKI